MRGSLDGLEESLRGVAAGVADQALLTVLTSLIDLLGGFIGEELTLRMVGEVWPDLPWQQPVQPGTFDSQEAAS